MNNVKDTIVFVTTVIAVLVIYFKNVNSFFLDYIKSKYENVPGKQPLLDTVIKTIFYIIVIIEIPSAMILIAVDVTNKVRTGLSTEITFNASIPVIIALIIAGSFFYMILRSVYVFSDCSKYFVRRLYSKQIENENNLNRKNVIILVISLALTALSIVIVLLYLYVSKERQLSKNDISTVITVSLIGIVSFTISIMSFSFKKIISLINSRYGYRIIIDNDEEELICRCYLEYKDYYLIIKNNEQLYINKSKVKMIKLIKEL